MIIESFPEIGGYFELGLPHYGEPFDNSFVKFQSARAALRAFLEHSDCEAIFLPAYICDSVIKAANDAGKLVRLYELDDQLYPKTLSGQLPRNSIFLYVNYFGLCSDNISRLLRDFSHENLIIDNTQALFESPTEASATIYSPRKFVGVPDGGLLVMQNGEIGEPMEEDHGSLDRMQHLLKRLAYDANAGYAAFIESGNSLINTTPLSMSRLTRRLLCGIDMASVKSRRQENYAVLSRMLDEYNVRKWKFAAENVPLCYPLLLKSSVSELRVSLAKKGVYIPTYWLDARARCAVNSIEHRMIHCCLAIPCDQRYSPDQMTHVAKLIMDGFATD